MHSPPLRATSPRHRMRNPFHRAPSPSGPWDHPAWRPDDFPPRQRSPPSRFGSFSEPRPFTEGSHSRSGFPMDAPPLRDPRFPREGGYRPDAPGWGSRDLRIQPSGWSEGRRLDGDPHYRCATEGPQDGYYPDGRDPFPRQPGRESEFEPPMHRQAPVANWDAPPHDRNRSPGRGMAPPRQVLRVVSLGVSALRKSPQASTEGGFNSHGHGVSPADRLVRTRGLPLARLVSELQFDGLQKRAPPPPPPPLSQPRSVVSFRQPASKVRPQKHLPAQTATAQLPLPPKLPGPPTSSAPAELPRPVTLRAPPPSASTNGPNHSRGLNALEPLVSSEKDAVRRRKRTPPPHADGSSHWADGAKRSTSSREVSKTERKRPSKGAAKGGDSRKRDSERDSKHSRGSSREPGSVGRKDSGAPSSAAAATTATAPQGGGAGSWIRQLKQRTEGGAHLDKDAPVAHHGVPASGSSSHPAISRSTHSRQSTRSDRSNRNHSKADQGKESSHCQGKDSATLQQPAAGPSSAKSPAEGIPAAGDHAPVSVLPSPEVIGSAQVVVEAASAPRSFNTAISRRPSPEVDGADERVGDLQTAPVGGKAEDVLDSVKEWSYLDPKVRFRAHSSASLAVRCLRGLLLLSLRQLC